jgi:hypothetical protein
MTDLDRLEETFEELRTSTSAKAKHAERHAEIAAERRNLAAQEGAKFRAMLGSFVVAQKALEERLRNLQSAEEPDEIEIQGHIFAIKNLHELMQQAERGALQTEGAFNALGAMEDTLRKEASDAFARVRGLEMQEKKAGGLSSRNSIPQEEILATGTGSAKEPMGNPQQRDSAAQGPQASSEAPLGGTGSP